MKAINKKPDYKITPEAVLVFIGYTLLLAYFSFNDFYHTQFFVTGFPTIAYNSCRLLFMAYSFWLYYVVGHFILHMFKQKIHHKEYTIETLILKFFSGAGIIHIVLFFIGLIGLYNRIFICLVTVVLFAFSLPELSRCQRAILLAKSRAFWPGLLVALISFGIFLMVKGIYPAGGHDYYMHYFYYYRRVIETGSILPNEVWYQFYYSKGAALFFLSMLLTDPLGPQLATTTFIIGAACVIYSTIKQSTVSKWLPWLSIALYFSFFIYTPGPIENMRQGGWGDLEKPHEPAAVLVLAILWQIIALINSKGSSTVGISLALSTAALMLISPMLGIYVGGFLTIITICLFFKKRKPLNIWICVSLLSAGIFLLLQLAINYYFTGLIDDHALLSFWPMINFEKIINWGVLFEIVIAHMAITGLVANKMPMSPDLIWHIFNYLRLDIWGPLLLCSIFLACAKFLLDKVYFKQKINDANYVQVSVFGGFLFTIIVFSMFVGRDEYISYYRFTTFLYAPVLCFSVLLLPKNFKLINPLILLITSLFAWTLNFHNGSFDQIVKNAFYFATGKFSIADAYRNQQGWPGRMPWGGIHPSAEKIWEQLPRHTRVWSMHVHTYCMLPDCRIESYQSYRLSPSMDVVYFGEPLEAKKILQHEGLNFFFFSKILQIPDPLPRSNLFSPQNINRHLGIVWTDGDNTLLTWKEQSAMPIDENWLSEYKKSIEASPQVTSFRFNEVFFVTDKIEKNGTIRQQNIPWFQAGWKSK